MSETFWFVVGVTLTALLCMFTDTYYEHAEQRLVLLKEICASMNSYPRSFDIDTLTCINGAEIEYSKPGEPK